MLPELFQDRGQALVQPPIAQIRRRHFFTCPVVHRSPPVGWLSLKRRRCKGGTLGLEPLVYNDERSAWECLADALRPDGGLDAGASALAPTLERGSESRASSPDCSSPAAKVIENRKAQ